jgi:hypothetical protein
MFGCPGCGLRTTNGPFSLATACVIGVQVALHWRVCTDSTYFPRRSESTRYSLTRYGNLFYYLVCIRITLVSSYVLFQWFENIMIGKPVFIIKIFINDNIVDSAQEPSFAGSNN